MVYLFEHGYKWDEIFKMTDNMIENYVKEIKSKMSSKEIEKYRLVFYLKANNYKSKRLKNMKTEKLQALVDKMKKEKVKSSVKIAQPEILMDEKLRKMEEINREIEKKRKYDVSSSGYNTQEIYSTTHAEGSKKVSAKERSSWFKSKPESSKRIVENFDIGIENFSTETLKEKVVSWRYDSSRDLYVIFRTRGKKQYFKNGSDIFKLPIGDLNALSRIKMNNTIPKGYDFENYLRRIERDRFKGIKNPNVSKRSLKRFSYVENANTREGVREQAPRAILPQYNERCVNNTMSLQPFTIAFVDPEFGDLVIERGNLEPIRLYEIAQLRCLVNEDIFALDSMNVSCKQNNEYEANYYLMVIKKLANFRRGLPKDGEA
ncbi:hypothetical protein L1987_06922 [Smallanthus sonchifolius]|uniref:Uncharacterized protein n=1 Tax=Smallanthus sonchifolius TaxID=185202 RepID=A0ACB9JZF2_9ASTR|nr:hypothetical protein L1987_06922 [Smallanthus sonchifolius]